MACGLREGGGAIDIFGAVRGSKTGKRSTSEGKSKVARCNWFLFLYFYPTAAAAE